MFIFVHRSSQVIPLVLSFKYKPKQDGFLPASVEFNCLVITVIPWDKLLNSCLAVRRLSLSKLMLFAAAISELGLNLGPLFSCNQDSLDYTNSLQVLFNRYDHFSSKIILSCFTSSDKHFTFTTSENKTLPKAAISEEVEEMECRKPVTFSPSLAKTVPAPYKKNVRCRSRVFFQEMLPTNTFMAQRMTDKRIQTWWSLTAL